MSLSSHPHVHVHVSVSLRLALPFYFTHFLPHSFHFLLHLKFLDNLRIPPKESMDLSDEFLFFTRTLPKGLSADQMRIHRLTHYPFRSWCPQCVAGRAKSWPHYRQEVDDDGGIPTICFDYCFLRDYPGGESVPVMVGREKRTKTIIAHVVPFKGGGVDWLVGQSLCDLRKIGCSRKAHSQKGPRERHLGCAQRRLQTEVKRERFSSDNRGVESKR